MPGVAARADAVLPGEAAETMLNVWANVNGIGVHGGPNGPRGPYPSTIRRIDTSAASDDQSAAPR